MLAVVLALAATAEPDCLKVRGAIEIDQCRLKQSMQQEFDCEKRMTQADLNVCSFRDYLRADIDLNYTWNQAKTRWYKEDSYSRLLSGQKAWLIYRNRHCSVWQKYYEGGSVASLMENACLANITKFRSNELKQLLEDD